MDEINQYSKLIQYFCYSTLLRYYIEPLFAQYPLVSRRIMRIAALSRSSSSSRSTPVAQRSGGESGPFEVFHMDARNIHSIGFYIGSLLIVRNGDELY